MTIYITNMDRTLNIIYWVWVSNKDSNYHVSNMCGDFMLLNDQTSQVVNLLELVYMEKGLGQNNLQQKDNINWIVLIDWIVLQKPSLFILHESVLHKRHNDSSNVIILLTVVTYLLTVYTVSNKPSPIQWVGLYRIHNINIH